MFEVVTGIFVLLTPWTASFPVLMLMVTIYGMGLGFFDTADNSLMIYMLGPKNSRPLTQSLHAFVGVGFIIGSFLVQPFLPDNNNSDSETNAVCPGANVTQGTEYKLDEMGGIPSINWPYIIIGAWHFLTAIGMVLLAASGLQMPSFFSTDNSDKGREGGDRFTEVKYWKSLLVMVYFYYVLSCGLEGFFQSMSYTFSLCGPLNMSPTEAALLNSVYYAAFMIGRCLLYTSDAADE